MDRKISELITKPGLVRKQNPSSLNFGIQFRYSTIQQQNQDTKSVLFNNTCNKKYQTLKEQSQQAKTWLDVGEMHRFLKCEFLYTGQVLTLLISMTMKGFSCSKSILSWLFIHKELYCLLLVCCWSYAYSEML